MKPGDLQTAYSTQTTHEGGKSEWIVYNTKNPKEIIYRLPASWTEKMVMEAIHFGRKFELIAFNWGVKFQKDLAPKTMKTLQSMVRNLTAEKEVMIKRNLELANELERMNEELDKLTIKNK